MAITLVVNDFKEPLGELQDELFPSGLDTLLSGWLAQATVKVTAATGIANQDAAAEAWVYYRAYNHIAQRMNAEAAQASLESGVSRTIASDQRAYFSARAIYWLDAYDALDTIVTVAEATTVVPPSHSVRIRATW